jgi:ribosomal protein S18 acetylase RimI-like enzyme
MSAQTLQPHLIPAIAMPDTSPLIRPAVREDAPSLAALSIEVWLGTCLRSGISGHFADYVLAQYTPAHFTRALQAPDEQLLVSQNRDGIDGYIRLIHSRPSPAGGTRQTEIATLYVQPRHHRRGLGKALLQAALQHGESSGWDAPWLTTNSENTAAIRFYHTQGFVTVGQTAFEIGDERYPTAVLHYARP